MKDEEVPGLYLADGAESAIPDEDLFAAPFQRSDWYVRLNMRSRITAPAMITAC